MHEMAYPILKLELVENLYTYKLVYHIYIKLVDVLYIIYHFILEIFKYKREKQEFSRVESFSSYFFISVVSV